MGMGRFSVFILVCLLFWACDSGNVPEHKGVSPKLVDSSPTNGPVVQLPQDSAVLDSAIDNAFAKLDSMVNPPVNDSLNIIQGVFVEIQEGDYFHLVMKDDAGKRHIFWFAPDLPESEFLPFLDMVHQPGKKISVRTRTISRKIPESDAAETVTEVYQIRLRD